MSELKRWVHCKDGMLSVQPTEFPNTKRWVRAEDCAAIEAERDALRDKLNVAVEGLDAAIGAACLPDHCWDEQRPLLIKAQEIQAKLKGMP